MRADLTAEIAELRGQLKSAGWRTHLKPYLSSDGSLCWVDITGRDAKRLMVYQLVWSVRAGWFAVDWENVPRPLGCDSQTDPRRFAVTVLREITTK